MARSDPSPAPGRGKCTGGRQSLAALSRARGRSASFCVFLWSIPVTTAILRHWTRRAWRAHTLLGVRWPGLFSPSSPGLSTSACIVGDKLAKTPRKLSKSVSAPVFLSLFHWCSFVPALHYAPSRIRRALFRARVRWLGLLTALTVSASPLGCTGQCRYAWSMAQYRSRLIAARRTTVFARSRADISPFKAIISSTTA